MHMENPLNQSNLAFPALEVFHILGFATVIGTIAVVDFRILGFGLMNRDSVQLQRDLFWWTVGALTVVVSTGCYRPILIFTISIRHF